MTSKSSKEHYHNQGEKDAAKGEYNSPRPNALQEFINPNSWVKDDNRKGDAYDAGWKNGQKQK